MDPPSSSAAQSLLDRLVVSHISQVFIGEVHFLMMDVPFISAVIPLGSGTLVGVVDKRIVRRELGQNDPEDGLARLRLHWAGILIEFAHRSAN